jgi:hypothetical protein
VIDVKTIEASKIDLDNYPSLKLKCPLVVTLDLFQNLDGSIFVELSRQKGDYLSFVELFMYIN